MSREFIDIYNDRCKLLLSELGHLTVDGLEISEDYFPEEYEQIQNAWNSVVKKIKELNQNKDE